MTDKEILEKLVAEIERQKTILFGNPSDYATAKKMVLTEILSFYDKIKGESVDDSEISCDAELCYAHSGCKYYNPNKKSNVNHCVGGMPLQLRKLKEESLSKETEKAIDEFSAKVAKQLMQQIISPVVSPNGKSLDYVRLTDAVNSILCKDFREREKLKAKLERIERIRRNLESENAEEPIHIESKEPISEELEAAAKESAKFERSDDTEVGYDLSKFNGFIEGAQWQKVRDLKMKLPTEITAAVERIAQESGHTFEQSFARLVAAQRAYKRGMLDMKEQIIKEGVDVTICRSTLYSLKPFLGEKCLGYGMGGKATLVLIKKD